MPTCLSFQIEENVKIDEPKPGYVEVYDYYEKGKATLCVIFTGYLLDPASIQPVNLNLQHTT